jgi:6-pyruvoyl-tetrahydropterin synthase
MLLEDAEKSDYGMVVDFGVLDSIMSELILKCDHRYLNESLPLTRTTAELLTAYFAAEIQVRLEDISKHLQVRRVEVWETRKACAIWTLEPQPHP